MNNVRLREAKMISSNKSINAVQSGAEAKALEQKQNIARLQSNIDKINFACCMYSFENI